MSKFYSNNFQEIVESFSEQKKELTNLSTDEIKNHLDNLINKVKNKELSKSDLHNHIEKLRDLKNKKETSDEIKTHINKFIYESRKHAGGMKLQGNLELGGVMTSKGYYLTDGTKINEIEKIVDKLAVPIDKEGNINLKSKGNKKINIRGRTDIRGRTEIRGRTDIRGPSLDAHVNRFNVYSHGRHSSFGSLNSGWCHLITNAPQFYMNKGLQVHGHIRSYSNKPINADRGVHAPHLSRVGGDWLRINPERRSVGRTAMYGGVSINENRHGRGGLGVGYWGHPGHGNIKATGIIKSSNNISNGLSRVGGDWLRINNLGNSVGRTAMYGGVSINENRHGKGGLGVGYWGHPGHGNIKATGRIESTGLSRVGGDWLRINNVGNSVGRTAMYGGVSINENRNGKGGLGVGYWGYPGHGNIKAKGTIEGNKVCITDGGKKYCIDIEMMKKIKSKVKEKKENVDEKIKSVINNELGKLKLELKKEIKIVKIPDSVTQYYKADLAEIFTNSKKFEVSFTLNVNSIRSLDSNHVNLYHYSDRRRRYISLGMSMYRGYRIYYSVPYLYGSSISHKRYWFDIPTHLRKDNININIRTVFEIKKDNRNNTNTYIVNYINNAIPKNGYAKLQFSYPFYIEPSWVFYKKFGVANWLSKYFDVKNIVIKKLD